MFKTLFPTGDGLGGVGERVAGPSRRTMRRDSQRRGARAAREKRWGTKEASDGAGAEKQENGV